MSTLVGSSESTTSASEVRLLSIEAIVEAVLSLFY